MLCHLADCLYRVDEVIASQVRDLGSIFELELGKCFQSDGASYRSSVLRPSSSLTVPVGPHYYKATKTLLNVVNRSVARTLVGAPLCYNESWLRTSLETTVNTGMVCLKLQNYPNILRPLAYPFIKSRRDLNINYQTAEGLLARVIKNHERDNRKSDILQWLMDSYNGDEFDIPFLTNQTLFVAIASTRSTATTIVNTLFDLVTFPECQEPLRTEIATALAEAGGWGLPAVQNMKKLDSFIKESQRLNHHLLRKCSGSQLSFHLANHVEYELQSCRGMCHSLIFQFPSTERYDAR